MNMDNLKILGFKAKIDSVNETLDLIDSIKGDGEIIQLLNADSIAGINHITHGVNQAFLAFSRGEIVLRCSAQRQISKAFKILGLKEGEMNLCAILVNCDDYTDELSSVFTLDNDVLLADEEKLMGIYGIASEEVKNISVEDLIIDRITKLTVDY